MSPYLRAYEAYHAAGPPAIPWADALDFHLQHGWVISTPETFVMARLVPTAYLRDHPTLTAFPRATSCVHVWAAAGDRRAMLAEMERECPHASRITYQRGTRGSRVISITANRLSRSPLRGYRGKSRRNRWSGHSVPPLRPGQLLG